MATKEQGLPTIGKLIVKMKNAEKITFLGYNLRKGAKFMDC